MELVAGQAPDLRTGWDFRLPRHKEAALWYVRKVRPKLVIGSPGCTVFSQLQNVYGSHWDRNRRDRLEEAQNHMRFIVEVYWEQVNHGRWFLHEHPVGASSWLMEELKTLQSAAEVCTTVADQCQYGLRTRGAGGAGSIPARKRTKFMTNSSEIANELSWKAKGHLHQALVGGRAHKSAIYSEGLCEAICRGLKREIRRSEMNVRVLKTVISKDKIGTDTNKDRSIADEEDGGSVGIAYGMAWDDLTGANLDPRGVSKARLKELGYISDKSVYKKITSSEAVSKGIRILKMKWIDIDKGDLEHPNYRSRFVAMEFNTHWMDGPFASTPPLEALKLLVSDAATVDSMAHNSSKEEKAVMVNDVARAFFEAPIRRELAVELPVEDGGGARK